MRKELDKHILDIQLVLDKVILFKFTVLSYLKPIRQGNTAKKNFLKSNLNEK